MPSGFWGDTQLIFRPGIATTFGYGDTDSPSTIQSRLAQFYSPARLAFWLKDGTFANSMLRFIWYKFYTNQNQKPLNPTDPDSLNSLGQPAYDWSYAENIFNLDIWTSNGIGPGLMISMSPTQGRTPAWFNNLGYVFTSKNNGFQMRFDLDAAVQEMKDFITAFAAKFPSNRKFWMFGIGESANGGSENFPPGFSPLAQSAGYADIADHIFTTFGGTIWPGLGANSVDTISQFTGPLICWIHPDPKLFNSGCTPVCSAGTSKRYLQDHFEDTFVMHGTEPNGLTAQVTWPSIANPAGHPAGYQAVPTARDTMWYFSSEGVLPMHVVYVKPYEWGNGGLVNWTDALIEDALNAVMAGGNDTFPALPANYDIGSQSGGGGTYTYVATGTESETSPGLPAGYAAGDLLLCPGSVRLSSETPNVIPGWEILISVTRGALWARFATGDSADALSGVDFWSNTSYNRQHIVAFRGGGYTDLSSIVVASNTSASANGADIPFAGITPPLDGCLVFAQGVKQKSATSNGAVLTSPTGLNNRIISSWNNGDTVGKVVDYTIQTTATTIDPGIWNQNVEEGSFRASYVIALQPGSSADSTAPTYHASPDPSGTAQDQTSILWAFNDSADNVAVTHYDAQYKLSSSSTWLSLPAITQATKTSDSGYLQTGLPAGTSIDFRYRPRDAAGNFPASWSATATESTDTPVDSAPPTFGGITSATYDADTGDVVVAFTKGTDAVDAQADLSYSVCIAVDPATPDFDADDYGPVLDVDEITLIDLPDGTYNIGVTCIDKTGNRSTNTDTEQVVVGLSLGTATIGPCDNGTGTPKTGDCYLFAAPSASAWPPIDSENPSANGELITLDSSGEYLFTGVSGETYHWKLFDNSTYDVSGDRNDIWTAEGWLTIP